MVRNLKYIRGDIDYLLPFAFTLALISNLKRGTLLSKGNCLFCGRSLSEALPAALNLKKVNYLVVEVRSLWLLWTVRKDSV